MLFLVKISNNLTIEEFKNNVLTEEQNKVLSQVEIQKYFNIANSFSNAFFEVWKKDKLS